MNAIDTIRKMAAARELTAYDCMCLASSIVMALEGMPHISQAADMNKYHAKNELVSAAFILSCLADKEAS